MNKIEILSSDNKISDKNKNIEFVNDSSQESHSDIKNNNKQKTRVKKSSSNVIIPDQIFKSTNLRFYTNREQSRYVELHLDSGIYDQDGKRYWGWVSFGIDKRIVRPNGELLLNYTLDGTSYIGKTFKDMEEEVKNRSCIDKPRYFGILIHRYLNKTDIPTINVAKICGFAENGWNLPPEKVFDKIKDSIQEKYIKQIQEMNELTVDPIEGAKYIDLLMDSISIPNKELLIAYAIASPFFHVLKKHTFLNPWTSFIGPPGSGKTQMMEIMVKTIWNSFTVTGRNISSEARFDNYVGVSTLPIGIDDVNDIPKGMWGTLKSYHTNDVNVQKLSKTQKLLQDEQWLASIIYTSNTRPEMFNDQGMNDRGVHFSFDSQPTDIKRFQNIKKIPYGYLGKCVIEFTKDWTEKEVLALFNSQEDAFPSDPRRNTIFKYFMIGAELTEQVFEKILFDDQAISRLKLLIQQSLTMGLEETLTTLIEQLREGRSNNRHERPYWIQSEIKIKMKYKSRIKNFPIKEAAVYTSDNYIDLKKRLNLQISFNVFIKHLQRVWTDIPKTPQDKISIDGITKNAILIPKEHFL